MNVLFVSNGFPPDRWAGTERYTASLAAALRARGADVRVLCGGHWDTGPRAFNGAEDSAHEGTPVRRLHLNWTEAPDPFRWLYDNPETAGEVERTIDAFRPDVVHVTSCETLSASVLRAVKARAVPLVLSLTDFWFLCPRQTLLRTDGGLCDGRTTPADCLGCLARGSRAYRWPRRVLPEAATGRLLQSVSRRPWLTRRRGLRGLVGDVGARKAFLVRALEWPDARITASSFVRSVYRANGVRVPIDVRPYGHDLSWLTAACRRTPSPILRLGYVGQIVEAKGLHVLLDALARLAPPIARRLHLDVHGDPAQSPAYGQRVLEQAAPLANVTFRGTYRHADSAATYGGMDVLVVPSLWYDFPLVAHEALATGAPVVATNLGGLAETVTSEANGLLFARGDAADLAWQLTRLVTEPGLLDRLRQGIRPVRTIADDAAELETLYGQLRGSMRRPSVIP
ncbi:MAG: glycosyltransferase family 4 protein [Vicinamibacterales bacterium]